MLEVDSSGNQTGRNIYGTNLLMRTAKDDNNVNQSYYYMYNGHADVTALINIATGSVAATYYYDAFGNIDPDGTTGDVNNNITFAGYQYDPETKLYYLNARMYDPKIARFLQEDTYTGTADDPLSLNLYAYCANNPIMYTDPTGHVYGYLDENGNWIGYTGSVNITTVATVTPVDDVYIYRSTPNGEGIEIARKPRIECDVTFGNPADGFKILTNPQRREETFALIDEYATAEQKNLAVFSASTADISYGMINATVGTLYQQVRYEGALVLNNWGVVSDTTFNTIKQERSEHLGMFTDNAIIGGIIKSGVNLYKDGYKLFDIDAPTSKRAELLDDAFVVVTTAKSALSLAKLSSTTSTANSGAKYTGYVKNPISNVKLAVKNMLSNNTGSIGPKNKLFKNSSYSNNKVSGNTGVGNGVKGKNIVGTTFDDIKPTQTEINPERVQYYIDKLKNGEKLDPVPVVNVPGKGKFLTEGHHRYVASQQTGIPIEIIETNGAGPIGLSDWSKVEWTGWDGFDWIYK